MLNLYGLIATTPRVGQNAVLGSIRTVVPGADQYGDARPSKGILILTAGYPTPAPNAHDTRYIRIRRQDKVAQAISWALADTTGRFLSQQTSNTTETPEFDRRAVQGFLDRIAADEKVWDRYLIGQTVLDLTYETDILPDPAAGASRILEWFGVKGTPGRTDTRQFGQQGKQLWRRQWDSEAANLPT